MLPIENDGFPSGKHPKNLENPPFYREFNGKIIELNGRPSKPCLISGATHSPRLLNPIVVR